MQFYGCEVLRLCGYTVIGLKAHIIPHNLKTA